MDLFLRAVGAKLKVDGGSDDAEVVRSLEEVVLHRLAQLVCVLAGQFIEAYNSVSLTACSFNCLDYLLFS